MSQPAAAADVGTVAVLGLGLIGGCIARDLAARGVRVLGHDRDAAAIDEARGEGAVHFALGPDYGGVEDAEAVVIAVPVLAALDVVRAVAPRLERARLVTDAGSTKASIGAAAHAAGIADRFVGAHPLAGSHDSGFAASRAGAFRGARVFLCPSGDTRPDALELAHALWSSLGAAPEVMDADEHDRRLAWTSHLPQAVSSALGAALARAGVPRAELGQGGRDVTRLAASSPEMWTDIALDNAAALTQALTAAGDALAALRWAIAAGDAAAVRAFFASAAEWAREG